MKNKIDEIKIEGARIIFRNFRGEKNQFNNAGDRNFSVVIDDEDFAKKLMEQGWNVKMRAPRDENEDILYHLPVKVSFEYYTPRIVMVTANSRNSVELDEDTIGKLDDIDISSVDVVIRPYFWEVNGNSGVKAYLKLMYAVIEEDPFEAKYRSGVITDIE